MVSEQLFVTGDEVKLMQPWQQLPASFFLHSSRARRLSELHMLTPNLFVSEAKLSQCALARKIAWHA